MRYWCSVILAVMLGTSAAWAVEKIPDLQDAMPQTGFRSVLQGALTASSPTYDRAFGDEISLNCDAPLTDSVNDGMYVEFFCIKSTDSNPVELVVDAAGTDIIDTVLTIYCQNFDPSDPLGNAIAYDDDGGEGTMSAITYDDGVILTPETVYWVVLSTYGASMTGTFLIQTSENLVTCDSVPTTSTTWGALKSTYR